jgi:hypothetical protein
MSSTPRTLPAKDAEDKIQTPSETSHPTDMEVGTLKDMGGDEAVLEQIGYKQVRPPPCHGFTGLFSRFIVDLDVLE